MHDWQYPLCWNRFAKHLYNLCPMAFGVRVLEPHAEHGLHYHLLLNRRLSVHIVRRLAGASGFGWKGQYPRVHVCVANEGVSFYLAKYLAKGGSLWPGLHRWATFGGYKGVKKNALEIDSLTMRAFRAVRGEFKWPYAECHGLWAECAHYGQIVLDRIDEICNDRALKASERLASVIAVTRRHRHLRRALSSERLNEIHYSNHQPGRPGIDRDCDDADRFFVGASAGRDARPSGHA